MEEKMSNKVTDLCGPSDELKAFAVNKLATYSGWSVKNFSLTDYQKLFDFVPELSLPAAVVSYHGSSYNDEVPRRSSTLCVTVLVEDFGNLETAAVNALPLMDKVLELLDHELNGKTLFRVRSDESIEYAEHGVAGYKITFTVDDF